MGWGSWTVDGNGPASSVPWGEDDLSPVLAELGYFLFIFPDKTCWMIEYAVWAPPEGQLTFQVRCKQNLDSVPRRVCLYF